ncbi:MAG: hypothetical protein ACRDD7_07085 [Peptostreptococcaceae bacterium]
MGVNSSTIKNLMSKYDRPFYVYNEEVINKQINTLFKKFPNFEFIYSIKANPYTPVVNFIASQGVGADAASSEEVFISSRAGLCADKILYSAAGKTRRDISRTIDKCIIIADSYNELVIINEIAKEKNISVEVGLRINPDYNMDIGKGESTKFGVDEETLLANKEFLANLTNISIVGIHVHIRSQVLDHYKLFKYYETVFNLALYCKDTMKWNLKFINFGGGIGLAYSKENDLPLDLDSLSENCDLLLEKFKSELNVRLIIETGRFLVCDCGQYVSHIVDIKESRGTKYLIVENGLNGFLRPSIVSLVNAYTDCDNPKSYEPFFTTKDAFEFNIIGCENSDLEKVDLVGNLCAATDILAKDIMLPKANIGDIVTLSKAGSYAYSLSPLLFTSHPLPLQVYVSRDDEVICL